MADFKAIGRWVLLTVAVMVGIIVPFLLFGHDVETWTAAFINDPGRPRGLVALVLGGLLASDIVLAAAAAGMPARRFFMLTTLSNVGISAVYAAIGAFAATLHSFLFALAGSLLLPWLGMLVTRRWRPKTCAF